MLVSRVYQHKLLLLPIVVNIYWDDGDDGEDGEDDFSQALF